MSHSAATPHRAIRARILTPLADGSTRFLPDGVLHLDGARIGAVEAWDPSSLSQPRVHEAGPLLDLRHCVLVPGFVDTHVHYPQTRVIGSASGPLLDWLKRTVFPEEARFRDGNYARAVAAELTGRLLAAGTTTAAIFSSSSPHATDTLFAALDAAGLRGLAGLTLMDRACPDALSLPAEEALAACERLIARWHGHDAGRLGFAITPRFALSCSRPLLEGAARIARAHGLLIQTHIAENPAEGVAVLEAHPWARDYLGVYEETGLIGPRTLLAHAIHLSPSEWDRAAAAGAAVAHCPDSNFFLGSGRMRLVEARDRGIRVGLGSDVAAGRSFDMRRAMAHAYDNALCLGERMTPAALLRLATLGGAEALGLDGVTGSLEAGKEADFVALRLPEYATDEEAILGLIAFADVGRVERVFVRGRAVHFAS